MHRAAIVVCVVLLSTGLLAGVGWTLWGMHHTSSPAAPSAADAGLVKLINQDGTDSGFAKSDTKLYVDDVGVYQEINLSSQPFDQIDLPSFTALGSGYLRDRNRVYYSIVYPYPVASKTEDGEYETEFATLWHAYLVPRANPSSFKVLLDRRGKYVTYGHDDKSVFYQASEVVGADPQSFSVKSQDDYFQSDRYHVFFFSGLADGSNQIVNGIDPSLFTPLYTPDGAPSIYARQGTAILCMTKLLDGAIPTSFVVGSSGYTAHDAARTYLSCDVCDPANLNEVCPR